MTSLGSLRICHSHIHFPPRHRLSLAGGRGHQGTGSWSREVWGVLCTGGSRSCQVARTPPAPTAHPRPPPSPGAARSPGDSLTASAEQGAWTARPPSLWPPPWSHPSPRGAARSAGTWTPQHGPAAGARPPPPSPALTGCRGTQAGRFHSALTHLGVALLALFPEWKHQSDLLRRREGITG